MHALVIEPQVFTSFVIEDALKDAGYTTVTLVATEEDAIAAADAEPPDLIAAAVRLPSGSGIRAVEQIRSKHDAPVIFITEKIAEVRGRVPEAPVVKKPFLFADLQPAIAQAQLHGGRSAREAER